MNGSKLPALNAGSASAMKIASATSFTTHEDEIDRRALARAEREQAGDGERDEDGRHVDEAAGVGPASNASGTGQPADLITPAA